MKEDSSFQKEDRPIIQLSICKFLLCKLLVTQFHKRSPLFHSGVFLRGLPLNFFVFFWFQSGGTNPGSLVSSFGGVGRNIAECLSRLGAAPLFLSAVGEDQNGRIICEHLTTSGLVNRKLKESKE